ncbi:MAG TPA: potassium transporter Kup [Rectinemataceae bacterium]|nr:potassium transporter Kup [Rectinemataceae bacterium]
MLALTIGAIGIVFGDIGTSPLYALRECFAPERGLTVDRASVLGIVSLLLWALTLIVCVKYLVVVLRADNRGEGGILALVSLVGRNLSNTRGRRAGLVAVVGIIGAALLYSDGMITPSISVLSAVEGLEIITPTFKPVIVPIAIAVLLMLFPLQARGTAKVGKLFAPVLTLWFVVLAVLGISAIAARPEILAAIDPRWAIGFLAQRGLASFKILGSVFLAVTGAEVLYADLGHFGAAPIRRAWFFLVFPALLLNYIGQGAHLLSNPDQVGNLFFRLAPTWFLYPLVILATAATIIASQAVISGSFSLARQSVQLGYWPRIQVRHTSDETIGQVYVPFINWFLMAGTIGLVLGFRESGRLGDAYGIAVSATMLMTTSLMIYVARRIWKVSPWLIVPFALVFAVVDCGFFLSNATKIVSGGWIVVSFAVLIFVLMRTWMDGRALFHAKMSTFRLAPDVFAASVGMNPPVRVPGSAVFLTGDPRGVPKALLHNLKHNRVLHEITIIVSVMTVDLPTVDEDERTIVTGHSEGIWQVVLSYGFSETPDVPTSLAGVKIPGFDPKSMTTTYFVGRESLVLTTARSGMTYWRKRLYGFMFGNALNATDFFRLPPNSVVEIGAQTEL